MSKATKSSSSSSSGAVPMAIDTDGEDVDQKDQENEADEEADETPQQKDSEFLFDYPPIQKLSIFKHIQFPNDSEEKKVFELVFDRRTVDKSGLLLLMPQFDKAYASNASVVTSVLDTIDVCMNAILTPIPSSSATKKSKGSGDSSKESKSKKGKTSSSSTSANGPAPDGLASEYPEESRQLATPRLLGGDAPLRVLFPADAVTWLACIVLSRTTSVQKEKRRAFCHLINIARMQLHVDLVFINLHMRQLFYHCLRGAVDHPMDRNDALFLRALCTFIHDQPQLAGELLASEPDMVAIQAIVSTILRPSGKDGSRKDGFLARENHHPDAIKQLTGIWNKSIGRHRFTTEQLPKNVDLDLGQVSVCIFVEGQGFVPVLAFDAKEMGPFAGQIAAECRRWLPPPPPGHPAIGAALPAPPATVPNIAVAMPAPANGSASIPPHLRAQQPAALQPAAQQPAQQAAQHALPPPGPMAQPMPQPQAQPMAQPQPLLYPSVHTSTAVPAAPAPSLPLKSIASSMAAPQQAAQALPVSASHDSKGPSVVLAPAVSPAVSRDSDGDVAMDKASSSSDSTASSDSTPPNKRRKLEGKLNDKLPEIKSGSTIAMVAPPPPYVAARGRFGSQKK